MSKNENSSWFMKLKQFLQGEPQNQDELISLLREAQVRALINSDALAMIEGVMHCSQMQVRDIMLPKNQMTCICLEDEPATILKTVIETGHSRFPVINDDEDIVGILHAKDLLTYQYKEASLGLLDICRQPSFVPESKRLDRLLSEFRTNKNHMAIVVDEYGEVSGLITIEDIVEQIIGDIEDEFDIEEDAYIKTHENNHYIIKAHMPIEDFNEQMHAQLQDEIYDTIGGMIMNRFGYLPQGGETMVVEDFEFKIINADARRIKLLECIDKRTT